MSQDPQALKASIETYYAEFGKDISRLVAEQLVDKGGFDVLLPLLGITDNGDPGSRYEALLTYLRTKGTGTFLARVSGLGKDYRIELSDTRELQAENDRRLRQTAIREAQRRKQIKAENDARGPSPSTVVQKIAPEPPPTERLPDPVPQRATASIRVQLESPAPGELKAALAAEAPPAPAWPVRFTGPLAPGSTPSPDKLSPHSAPYDDSKPYNPTGEWPAVERRSGIERRSGDDRRGNVELIFKNRRYGRDRRSKMERRRSWYHRGYRTADGGYIQ